MLYLHNISLTVEEDVGVIFIPLLRRGGTYGQIMAEYITHSFTALANIDFILPNGSVTFNQGQNQTYINVSIIDDLDR